MRQIPIQMVSLDSEDDDDDNDGVLDVEEIAAGSDPLVAEP